MGDPKTASVEFRALSVGQRFWIYGDSDLNYDYPKVCECIKDSHGIAHEVGGISFHIEGSAMVSIDKAAFEAKQKPEPQQYANNKEIADALQSGSFSWAKIPTLPESEPSPVGYIAVAPDDHAELCRKADLYNECKAVIDRLYCELEDLKKLFV